MDFEIVKLFWEWYFPYNNQEIYKDDIAKMAFVAGYKAAQQSAQADTETTCPTCGSPTDGNFNALPRR